MYTSETNSQKATAQKQLPSPRKCLCIHNHSLPESNVILPFLMPTDTHNHPLLRHSVCINSHKHMKPLTTSCPLARLLAYVQPATLLPRLIEEEAQSRHQTTGLGSTARPPKQFTYLVTHTPQTPNKRICTRKHDTGPSHAPLMCNFSVKGNYNGFLHTAFLLE